MKKQNRSLLMRIIALICAIALLSTVIVSIIWGL